MSIHIVGKSSFIRNCIGLALVGGACFSAPRAETLGAPPQAGKGYEENSKECRPDRSGKHPLSVVKSFYENLGKGDLPAILETFAKDAKWVLHAPAATAIPFAGAYEGRAAVQTFIETFGKNAKPSKFETREFIVEKGKVVVLGYEEVTAIPTGKIWKAHWTMVFTVQNGKIVFVDEVVDTEAISTAFKR
ncbi:MAG TPA: nuclear transport factor 2 family protein [Fibrobacteria bacterium]|nr:nuclear transport factor 2 family protein [Fibrobacteria bacterium]